MYNFMKRSVRFSKFFKEVSVKNFLFLFVLPLVFISCDRMDKKPAPPSDQTYENDNTGRNVRDRDMTTTTPENQSETTADREVTRSIRQSIMVDDSLSTNAKNIKIITMEGVVTLRGPVASEKEKAAIQKRATSVRGVKRVDNQLEIAR